MASNRETQTLLDRHVARLQHCRRCPLMHPPPVSGAAIVSRILLVGQAPGVREPAAGKPFAWTAGRTLFRWLEQATGFVEHEVRARIYFAAVCRCFPGKAPGGSDRVPNPQEIANCSSWLHRELEILQPRLVLPVGKLAIAQFMPVGKLDETIGRTFRIARGGRRFDLIPLPHPSGASPWPRMSPGRELLAEALGLIGQHAEVQRLTNRESTKAGTGAARR